MTWAEFSKTFNKMQLDFFSIWETNIWTPLLCSLHFIASAIVCHKLIVIALTWEGAYGSCQTILFISSLQLLWKQTEILGRTLKTWISFCMHSYLC